MRGDQKTARIIMLEDLEKDERFEVTEGGKERELKGNIVAPTKP